jgi:hypothetical protein
MKLKLLILLLIELKRTVVYAKVAVSCSILHSRLWQQKDVKLSALHSIRFTLQNVTTVHLRLDIFVVLRTKLGAWKRVKSPKPYSFDIHLLNSIKKPLCDTTRPYHLVFIDVYYFFKTDCKVRQISLTGGCYHFECHNVG